MQGAAKPDFRPFISDLSCLKLDLNLELTMKLANCHRQTYIFRSYWIKRLLGRDSSRLYVMATALVARQSSPLRLRVVAFLARAMYKYCKK